MKSQSSRGGSAVLSFITLKLTYRQVQIYPIFASWHWKKKKWILASTDVSQLSCSLKIMTSQNKFNKELLLVALIKCLGLLSCLGHCFWDMETQDSLMLSQVQNVDQFTLVWKKNWWEDQTMAMDRTEETVSEVCYSRKWEHRKGT